MTFGEKKNPIILVVKLEHPYPVKQTYLARFAVRETV